jgi:hypothetical protein
MGKETKKQQIIMMNEEHYRYLKIISMVEDLSMSAIVITLIEEDMGENQELIMKYKDILYKR